MVKKPLILSLAVFATPALADYSFIPKLGYAQKNYKLDMGDGFPSSKDVITASASGTIWGFTLAHSSRWYFDFEQFDSGVGTHEGFVEQEDDYIRHDVTFSIGRSFKTGYTVFGGLRFGNSEFRFDRGDDIKYGALDNDAGGPFIGAAKNLPLSDSSNLTLSAGLAALTAEFKSFDTGQAIDAKGDTIGFSLAGAFNKRIFEKWNLSAGVRYQAYEYQDVKDDATVIGDQSEAITSMFAKVGYIF